MKGAFENDWKNAFDDASIAPSDSVWNGIASSMDSGSGRRNWVTLLVVAATVTVAFAFPLTVGNSSYELKPQEIQLSEIKQTEELQVKDELLGDPVGDVVAIAKVEQSSRPRNQEKISKDIAKPLLAGDLFNKTASIQIVGIKEYQCFRSAPEMAHENTYILPVFMKKRKKSNFLLAYGTLQSGVQTATAGLQEFDMINASSDIELSGPDWNDRQNSFTRNESGGVALNIGLGIVFPIKNRLSIAAGISYQNQRFNGESNAVLSNGKQYPLGIYDKIEPGTVFLSEPFDYVSNNSFIGLPITLRYALINKNIKLRGGIGVSTDFMIGHKVSSAGLDNYQAKLSSTNYNKMQVAGLVSLDVLFPLHSNYGISFETGYRHGLMPVVREGTSYISSFTMGVTLFYRMK